MVILSFQVSLPEGNQWLTKGPGMQSGIKGSDAEYTSTSNNHTIVWSLAGE